MTETGGPPWTVRVIRPARASTVPSGLGLLFTPWRFSTALLVSGLATMAAIGYLLMLMRTGRFTATTLSLAVLPYVAFAVCLIPVLD